MHDQRLTDLVSVVICARDRERLIEKTLESIVLNQPGEIVVIDDCSRDHTAEVVRRFTTTVLPSGGNGLAAARQLGALTAQRRYVAYVDSDVVLAQGCLATMAAVLESDPTVGAAQVTIQSPDAESYWQRGDLLRRQRKAAPVVGDRDAVSCCATLFRRELILEHRFDPFFVGAGEDVDFSRRLKSAGWRLYRTDAIAYHSSRESLLEFAKQRFWYGRGTVRLAMRGTTRDPAPPSTQPPAAPAPWPARVKMIPFQLISGLAFNLGKGFERVAQTISRPGK